MLVSGLQTPPSPWPAVLRGIRSLFPPSHPHGCPVGWSFFPLLVASSAAACQVSHQTQKKPQEKKKRKGPKRNKIRSGKYAVAATVARWISLSRRTIDSSPTGSQIISPPSSTLILKKTTKKKQKNKRKPSQQKTAKKQAKKDNERPSFPAFLFSSFRSVVVARNTIRSGTSLPIFIVPVPASPSSCPKMMLRRSLDSQRPIMAPSLASQRNSKRYSTISNQTTSSTMTGDSRMAEIKELSAGLARLENKRLSQQRFVPTPEKSESLSKLALGAKVERALGRRMSSQDAVMRKPVVLDEKNMIKSAS
ncbi:uncharacterized protein ARB_01277 [Trichophyton benhamiae CBS 112371]|uniref:Uncharacterized protein n=6 Tax=Trichophyton TaxID=5550 RepID=D4AYK8_ARTBC|nr:uncharacterized protein ARB_01277 [Trichophyton benhamiae CBS 112371]EFE31678.1 hypothetical protein ARB_01277 [Trichophyton benhamiae CBS 112371]